jgi:hypothetical protein
MGLGIGEHCTICDKQLYYDIDGAEISEMDYKNEEFVGEAKCHECVVAIKRIKAAQE